MLVHTWKYQVIFTSRNDHHCYGYIAPLKVLRCVAVCSKHHRFFIAKSSVIFVNRRQRSYIFGKCPETFEWSSDNFRGVFGNLRLLVDVEYLFSCSTSYLTHEIHVLSWTLEDILIPFLCTAMYYLTCSEEFINISPIGPALIFISTTHRFWVPSNRVTTNLIRKEVDIAN